MKHPLTFIMEKITKKNIIVGLTILLSITNINIAQLNLSLGSSQIYSSNPFNSPYETPSLISSLDFGIENQFNSFGIGYFGSYNSFNQISDRNFYWHQIGLWNTTDSSMYGFYVEQRINENVYDFYNYTDYNVYHKYLIEFSDYFIFTNIAANLTDYSSLDDLDNIFGKAGISVNKSFESGTTLIGGLNFNYKYYFSTDLNDPNLVGDSLKSSTSNSYNSQLNLYFRIAQSLGEFTGLALHYSMQNILGSTADYTRQLEYLYGDESQFFDDPTSYQGYNLSIQLTQILPEQITFRTNYAYGKKEYPSHGTFINDSVFDPNLIRIDNQSSFSVSLTKNFDVGIEDQNMISLSIFYNYLNNNSNSFWYNFNTSQIDFSFQYQF